MAKTSERKNSAAVALSKRRLVTMTAEERSAVARNSVRARWRKARGEQPKRWYVLVAIDDPNHPQIIDSDADKEALRRRAHLRPDYSFSESDTSSRPMFFDYIEWNPTHFAIERRYQPDTTAQVEALTALLDSESATS